MKTIYSIIMVSVGLFMANQNLAQNPGTFNNDFGIGGYQNYDEGGKDQFGLAIVTQPDGKVIVGGAHEHTNAKYDWLIYRLNVDGSLDNSFSNDGKYSTSFSDEDLLVSVGVQSDGKILIAGYSNLGGGNYDIIVQRLKADGSLDNTFGTNGKVQLDRSVGGADGLTKMIITPDDKIYLGGFMEILGETYYLVHRLTPDGVEDNTFSNDGNVFYDTDSQGSVRDMDVASNGDVALTGAIVDGGEIKMSVVKFTSEGKFDDSFSDDGILLFTPGANEEGVLNGITFLPNNDMMVVGYKSGNNYDAFMAQITATGSLDGTFNGNGMINYDLSLGGDDVFEKIERLPSGKYLLLAETQTNISARSLYQINVDGTIDAIDYGNGTGKLNIQMGNNDETIAAFTIGNGLAYTVGYYENGQHNDVFVSSSHLFNPTTSIVENKLSQNAMKVFPNPANTQNDLSILLDDEITGNVKLSIHSIDGRLVYNTNFYKVSSEYSHKLQLTDVSKGMFFVTVENEGKSVTQKLIIQ